MPIEGVEISCRLSRVAVVYITSRAQVRIWIVPFAFFETKGNVSMVLDSFGAGFAWILVHKLDCHQPEQFLDLFRASLLSDR